MQDHKSKFKMGIHGAKQAVLVLVLTLSVANVSFGTYSGGTGEPNDPYRIATANDLNDIGNHIEDFNKCFVMVNDINLADYNGTQFNIIGSSSDHFIGVFDGNEHSITNFNYQGDSSYVGLFCRVGNDDGTSGEIRNLTLVDPNVDAGTGDRVGALASVFDRGTISGCGVVGGSIVGSDNVGGLVGMISFALKAPWEGDPAILTDCYSTASVSGNGQVGGLAGGSYGGIVTDSYSAGTVSGSSYEVGGLIGANYDANILDSYSTATVSGESMVGGLVGGTYHKYSEKPAILNCYAEGSVTATDYSAGGLVGDNDAEFTIRNSYSSADVNGDSVAGGLVGSNGGYVFNCYSSGSVSGNTDVGGLMGYSDYGLVQGSYWDANTSNQSSSGAGQPKTTAQMKDPNTFVGWGCDGVWTIDAGNDYPRLWFEDKPGEPIGNPTYGGGNGELGDPYLIYTTEQLNGIGLTDCHWNKHFKLMADINLAAVEDTGFNIVGYGTLHRKAFTGVFDGNDHVISNLTHISNDRSYLGLFGLVDDPNAEIRDIALVDPNIQSNVAYVGGLVGLLKSGSVRNCVVESGIISGDSYIGGLVGQSEGTILKCNASTDVYGEYYPGGLVGYNSGTLSKSYATGSVMGDIISGGLVGGNTGTISDCYARGSVSATGYRAGGLVGGNAATIDNCYSTGVASGGSSVGGLVGHQSGGAVTDSFWDVNSSGLETSAAGTGKTTAEMQTESTFTDAGWDFVEVWGIGENQTYPFLRVYPAGDLNHDGLVNMLDFAIAALDWLEGAEE
jgi:hypothetical protein